MLDFLGFRIQWERKRGMSKWYVSTFTADRPVRSVKDKSVPCLQTDP
jgi:RNA-directed DNA polymerase